jgi:nicotinate-nucleotide pyrophosphorylase (carboxylating)|tara:strand:+ start:198 stop:1076 length:879 start_codon:yes stop_codon:yes gene_type:complete
MIFVMDEICDVTSALIDLALNEDLDGNLKSGDVTSMFFVPEGRQSESFIHAKADGVLAGMKVAKEVFRRIDPDLQLVEVKKDGDVLSYGDHVLEISGSARSILTAERTALNFLQRLSGIATQTRDYVALTDDTKAEVLDTRKTTPGWRALEKMAVVAGGGTNHRMGLYDRAMVKDNHLVAQNKLEALQDAICQLNRDRPSVEVELETDTLKQVEDFLGLEGVQYILLDNMDNETMKTAVAMRDAAESKVLLEASGGVNLDTIANIAKTGVDFISVGALTHSAVALDLSLDFK